MSRAAVFHYKGQQADPQKVGHDLNVEAVLTGTFAQRGDNLHIDTALVDVRDGSELWGEGYGFNHGATACPQPYRQHPSRHRPISRRCGSAKWFDRSMKKTRSARPSYVAKLRRVNELWAEPTSTRTQSTQEAQADQSASQGIPLRRGLPSLSRREPNPEPCDRSGVGLVRPS
jgi:hypothetical protein